MAQSPEAHERWYAINGDKCRQRSRDWYEQHKARVRANQRRYAAANPEKIRAARKKWLAANPITMVLARCKARAKKNGLSFDLTFDDIVLPSHCPVLGIPLIQTDKQHDNSPSIDRIDNTLGYVKGNVVVISWRANRLKSDATHEEMARLAAFFVRK